MDIITIFSGNIYYMASANFNPNHILKAFEKHTGSLVCFHDFNGYLLPLLEEKFIHHRTQICEFIKAKSQKNCVLFEGGISREFLLKNKNGFWKCCHAGVLEMYIPIWHNESLSASIFCGQFKWQSNKTLPEDVLTTDETITQKENPFFNKLKPLSLIDMKSYLEMGRLLALKFEMFIAREYTTNDNSKNARIYSINQYFLKNYSKAITIKNLSVELNLSASRTGQILKELFNKTFPQLLYEERLRQAATLLIYTELSGADIARQCGYNDSGYFYRLFKKVYHTTPLKHREDQRRKLKITIPAGP